MAKHEAQLLKKRLMFYSRKNRAILCLAWITDEIQTKPGNLIQGNFSSILNMKFYNFQL